MAMVVSGRHALCTVSHTLTQPWFEYASPIQSATLSSFWYCFSCLFGKEGNVLDSINAFVFYYKVTIVFSNNGICLLNF